MGRTGHRARRFTFTGDREEGGSLHAPLATWAADPTHLAVPAAYGVRNNKRETKQRREKSQGWDLVRLPDASSPIFVTSPGLQN